MAKLTLADVSNILGNPTTAQATINANSDATEIALEKTLSRDGTSPNQMLSDLDMNTFDIMNVGTIDVTNFVYEGIDFADLIDQAQDAADAASVSAALASGFATTATTQAGIATTQAGIATTAAASLTNILSNPNTWTGRQTFSAAPGSNRGAVNVEASDPRISVIDTDTGAIAQINGQSGNGSLLLSVDINNFNTASVLSVALAGTNVMQWSRTHVRLNGVPLADAGGPRFADSATPTKGVTFVTSGITAATFRNVTFPDRDVTLGMTLVSSGAIPTTAASDFVIPSGVRRIKLVLAGYSTNGAGVPQVQLRTGGAPVTSGYAGAIALIQNASSPVTAANSTGLRLTTTNAATSVYQTTVEWIPVTGNQWFGTVWGSFSDTALSAVGSASVTLGGVIDGLRLTSNGTDVVDAGNYSLYVEY